MLNPDPSMVLLMAILTFLYWSAWLHLVVSRSLVSCIWRTIHIPVGYHPCPQWMLKFRTDLVLLHLPLMGNVPLLLSLFEVLIPLFCFASTHLKLVQFFVEWLGELVCFI
uniref:Uncharacterized protein n=1 Tax=Arundo donax TaxID=35708 RepID=A0A0A8YP07_ARUDO